MIRWLLLTVLYLFAVIVNGEEQEAFAKEKFYEELVLRQLSDGKVNAHMQFTTIWEVSQDDPQSFEHFGLFPKSLGQVIHKFNVDELHLSLSQGRWQQEWGVPVITAPVGLEFYAWFKDIPETDPSERTKQINKLWKGLNNVLAGLFCASMEEMKETVTAVPLYAFSPNGLNNSRSSQRPNSDLLRYSILPRETVCTENLTPWLKLLPCRSKAGIAQLANPLKFYEAHYHSMGTHIRSVCSEPSCSKVKLELTQTLTTVIDPFPFPPYKMARQTNGDWNFYTLFARGEVVACPLATQSMVYVQHPLPSFGYKITLNVEPHWKDESRNIVAYDLKKMDKPFNLDVENDPIPPIGKYEPGVTVQRYFTGYGQEYGGIAVHIRNHKNVAVNVTYFEMVPWYLRLYFHTFSIYFNDTQVDLDEALEKTQIIPGEDHASPAVIEFVTSIPAQTVLSYSVQFEKAFLHWTEYPPDPNRGFDVGAGVLSVSYDAEDKEVLMSTLEWSPILYPNLRGTKQITTYTDTLLVSLPLPDFSMPYNVITLTGTVFALFFGSVFNILVRRMKQLDKVGDEYVSNRPLARLLRKIVALLGGSNTNTQSQQTQSQYR